MSKASFFEWLKKQVNDLLGANSTQQVKTAPAKKAPQQEPYVYVTAGGKKFHYDILCPGIRNSKEIKMSLSKARKAGYTACDKCCFDYLHKQKTGQKCPVIFFEIF